MSQQSVEVVRKNFDAWNRGGDDLKAFVDEHVAPDVTLFPFADFADSQIRHGREEALLHRDEERHRRTGEPDLRQGPEHVL